VRCGTWRGPRDFCGAAREPTNWGLSRSKSNARVLLWIAAFSPTAIYSDGRRLSDARLLDSRRGPSAISFSTNGIRRSAGFSPDGSRSSRQLGNNSARIWDTGTGKAVMKFEGPYPLGQIARFSPRREVRFFGERRSRRRFSGSANTAPFIPTLEGSTRTACDRRLSQMERRSSRRRNDKTAAALERQKEETIGKSRAQVGPV